MQLGLIQFLLGNGLFGANAGQAQPGGGDLFSLLLGDGQANADTQAEGQANTGLAIEVAPGALLGQDIGEPHAIESFATLSQTVTPEKAGDLIATLDALKADIGEGDREAFDQLREALEEIEASGEPQPVGELVEQLPAIAALDATDSESAPLVQRVLGFLHHAINKQKESAPQLALVPVSDGATQSLQASLFRAGDASVSGETTDRAEPAETPAPEALITTVTPLAYTQLSAIPAWVRKIGDETVEAPIDDAIPALAVSDTAESLPEIDLPAAPVPESKTEKAAHLTFQDLIQSNQPEALDQATVQPVPVTQVDSSGLLVQHASASHPSITPQTQSAIEHVATHTAAAEQVHVAITTARKDGLDTITLQLEPADLGRVEVRMELRADGQTQLNFTVDKAETLDALSRDARSLERSLQEAGIKADTGSMQFNLRQQPQPQPQFTDLGGDGNPRRNHQPANDNAAPEKHAAIDGITRHYTLNVREGVDIHA